MLRRFLNWLWGNNEPPVVKVEVSIHVKEITIRSDSPQTSRTESNQSAGPASKTGPIQVTDEQALERFTERVGGGESKKPKLSVPQVPFGDETR